MRRKVWDMESVDRTARAEETLRLARRAVAWLLNGHAADSEDPSLYHGQAGVVLALQEMAERFGDERCGRAAAAGGDALAAKVESLEDCSLYFGLAGVAGALRSLGRDEAADRALSRIRDRFDGERWNEMFELLVGNAGIGLGALWAGDVDLAVMAVTPYLATADRTAHGVNWPVRPSPPRSHHIAHGTLGIAYALAAVGQAAAREDLIELALSDHTVVPHADRVGEKCAVGALRDDLLGKDALGDEELRALERELAVAGAAVLGDVVDRNVRVTVAAQLLYRGDCVVMPPGRGIIPVDGVSVRPSPAAGDGVGATLVEVVEAELG